ncbi:MAG TPA: redoxin domain-containing protein, partial [Fimbriimonadaceae bacterium]|nr:redoxin domain-containing protein [Fimbriimonadaceae bacterium]
MKTGILAILAVSSLFVVAAFRSSESTPASAFTLTSSKGKSINLTDFKGKWVVLEWWNYQCPFVQKDYNSGN